MTLTEFLLARIAEDEGRIEREVFARLVDYYDAEGDDAVTLADGPTSLIMDGLRPHVLAECEAKRRIVAKVQRADVAFSQSINPTTSATSFALIEVLHLLTLPYADHPDYDPEWRL